MIPSTEIPSLGYTAIIAGLTTLIVVVGSLCFGLRAERKRPKDQREEH